MKTARRSSTKKRRKSCGAFTTCACRGNSARTIARTLTDEGIPNPTAYYTRLDGKKSERRNSFYWSPKTVSDILKDRTYTGTLTQHRTTRFSYKNHKVLSVPRKRAYRKGERASGDYRPQNVGTGTGDRQFRFARGGRIRNIGYTRFRDCLYAPTAAKSSNTRARDREKIPATAISAAPTSISAKGTALRTLFPKGR